MAHGPFPARTAWRAMAIGSALLLLASPVLPSAVRATESRDAASPVQIPQVADSSFRHDMHRDFACLDCHTLGPGHGALRVRDVEDCRDCHHVAQRDDRACSACHEAPELERVVYPVDRVLRLSVRDGAVRRSPTFSHTPHRERECVECHAGGATLAVPDLDCQSCHEEHHGAEVSGCATCHEPAQEGAHTLAVHESCSGSGCHVDPPIEQTPRTRIGCLWCHEDRVDHEPQDTCTECHFLADGGPGGTVSMGGPSVPARRSPRGRDGATLPGALLHSYVRGHRARG